LRIAEAEGAEQYASDSYQHAVRLMNKTDEFATSKHIDRKPMIAVAREAVQTAEDARAITVQKIEQERLDNERQAAADAQAQTQADADDATRQKEQAQSDRSQAEFAKAQAESDTANAQTAKRQAESDTAAAQAARAQAESDTANARAESAQAQSDSDRARSDMADNQAASASALSAAQADAEQSRQSAQQADADKAAMRTRLSEQLNKILQTRDTARGLIVSMSDVLFDTGKYSLKPGAREKLAKVAGILLAYPGLDIAVGGYTDNVGGDAMNQKLSENRAGSVRDYLVQQGVASNSVTVTGFGNSLAVASNDNAAGRQQNRRVELVVSGEAIGSSNTTTGSLQ
jgi:outer membrane protein OmpA-like peptidoglycan-associated protein